MRREIWRPIIRSFPVAEMKSRITDMQKFQSDMRAKPVRINAGEEKSAKIYSVIKEGERDSGRRTIKTLAGARWNEIKKVKDELKAMLPILKPSEVKRFNFIFYNWTFIQFFLILRRTFLKT